MEFNKCLGHSRSINSRADPARAQTKSYPPDCRRTTKCGLNSIKEGHPYSSSTLTWITICVELWLRITICRILLQTNYDSWNSLSRFLLFMKLLEISADSVNYINNLGKSLDYYHSLVKHSTLFDHPKLPLVHLLLNNKMEMLSEDKPSISYVVNSNCCNDYAKSLSIYFLIQLLQTDVVGPAIVAACI